MEVGVVRVVEIAEIVARVEIVGITMWGTKDNRTEILIPIAI